MDLRNPVIDFADPEIRDLFLITANPRAAQFETTEFSGIDDSPNPFWDDQFNTGRDRHASFQLFDFPNRGPVSAAALRQMPAVGKRPFWIGSPDSGGGNRWFDETLFSGVSPSDSWDWDGSGTPPPFPNTRLRLLPGRLAEAGLDGLDDEDLARHPDLAAATVIEGAFNINSLSVPAWEALLTNNLPDWKDRDDAAFPLERVFFRRPFHAGLPPAEGAPFRDDATLLDGGLSEPAKKATFYSQAFRAVGPGEDGEAVIAALAGEIVEGIRNRQSTSGPFRSVAEFLDEGILAAAIDAAEINGGGSPRKINEGIPAAAAQHLTQGDLLEALAPVLTHRSDMFRVRVLATRVGDGGSAAAEARIVRLARYVDPVSDGPLDTAGLSPVNERFGRAFRVVDFRFIE